MDAKALQVFSYKEHGVRIVEIDGEPWFVAKDVCDILEIQNVSQAVENLDDDEKGISKTYTLNGMQDMTVISEPGVYALVMKSRKPEAKQFSRWVRHEVLPSIRKTGSYTVRQNTVVPVDPIAGAKIVFEAAGIKDNQLALALDRVYMTYTGASALEAGQITLTAPTKKQPDISDDVKYVSVSNNEADMRFMEMGVKNSELRLKGAEILFELLKEPPVQMNDDCKTLITYEIFSLASGHDYLETLTQYHSRTDENAQ